MMRHANGLRAIAASLLFTCSVQAQTADAPINRLKASIQLTAASINAKWGIYMKSLATGEELAINADTEMETASTIKIALMIEVMQQVHDKKLKLTDKYIPQK